MAITPVKVLCITGKFFSSAEIRYCSNAMLSFTSSKLSATSLSPNPALAKHYFTVPALLFFTANLIQYTASSADTDLANA
jgi:hypothetical protein